MLIFLFRYLGINPCLLLFWRSCYLADVFLIKNCPLKRNVPNFPSCCINNSPTYLLSIPHPKHFSFWYGIEKFLDLRNDLDWYCWPVYLWTCWTCFGPFWSWKVLPKLLLRKGSVTVEECSIDMSTSAIIGFQRLIQLQIET